jgi:hypothetical protein
MSQINTYNKLTNIHKQFNEFIKDIGKNDNNNIKDSEIEYYEYFLKQCLDD